MNTIITGRSDQHDMFQMAAEAFLRWQPGTDEPTITYAGVEFRVTETCNMVSDMPDIFPSGLDELREILEFDSWTHGAIARAMSEYISARV